MTFPKIYFAPPDSGTAGGGDAPTGNAGTGNAGDGGGSPPAITGGLMPPANTGTGETGSGNTPPSNTPEDKRRGETGNAVAGNDRELKNTGNTESPYRPDGLPDDLYGKSDQETIDKLMEGYNGRAPAEAPATPADYSFELADDVAAAVGNAEDDPALGVFRQVVFDNKVPNDQATKLFNDVMQGWIKAGIVQPPVNPEQGWSELGNANETDPAKKIASGQLRVNEVAGFIQGLENRSVLTADQKVTLTKFAVASPDNIQILEALKGGMASPGIRTGGDSDPPVSITEDDLTRRRKDVRNRTDHPQFDAAFRKETDVLSKQFYSKKS